jgi:hypothetical protein
MLGKSLRLAALTLLMTAIAAADTIPTGTHMTVRLGSAISSGSASSGQSFRAMLAQDLVVHGKRIASAGAPVDGKITYVKPSGRLHAPGQLTLRLSSVEVNGRMVPLSTTAYHAKGKSHTKSNVTKIGGGAAAGALLGGLMGGGKGALIGTAAGAGAGTGLAAATGKEEAHIPAEAVLAFTTTSPATVK